jgi:hypothetical protein
MPLSTDDVRKYGETVLEQSKIALDEARKPWLAAVGATELAYGQIREQLKDLPTELRKLRTGAGQIDAAQVRDAVEGAAGTARQAAGTYATAARETYQTLAHRGELVVRRIRRSPEVGETFGKAEGILAGAEKAVEHAENKVTRPTGTTRTAPARKTPAKTAAKAPAKRTTS